MGESRAVCVAFEGEPPRRVAVPPGTTLLEAAQVAGVPIEATCGGRGRCRSCRVQIRTGSPPPPTLADRLQLGEDEIHERFRLACQATVWEDVGVAVAPPREERAFQILTETRGAGLEALDPGVRKILVRGFSEAVQEEAGRARMEEVLRQLAQPVERVEVEAVRSVARLLREAPEAVTAVLYGNDLLQVEAEDTTGELYGFAVDIGTTTVVGYLLDLREGEVRATVTALNPQSSYGGDLMSRIAFVQQEPGNVRRLHTRAIQCVNGLLEEACHKAGIARDRIYKVVVVGNTIMHHLFLGVDPSSVGRAPYLPLVRAPVRVRAQELGLRLPPQTPVLLLPLVAGFVGADAVGMVLATRIFEGQQVRLAVDIGTNAEVVIGSRVRLAACSAPAGPALEGAQIRWGMRAAQGAVDRVWIGEGVRYRVIGGGPPTGICGSGLVDAVAGLLEVGVLEPSGRLLVDPPAHLPEAVRRRVTVLPDGQPAFVLVPREESGAGEDIVVTQTDIRQVQLAKGAIRSGITVVERYLGIEDRDLAGVLLAGAFGNYLHLPSAIRIGLIPPLPQDRIVYVGNAAGLGAQLALLSEREGRRAEELARRIEHVPLAAQPDFHEVFLRSVRFPDSPTS
ncbi:MAG: ASKHA domain-containing protein [Armatimonadota bacterium]|nr:ASKHA domain-containing protein [Armatimonadota bacterium]MDR7438917.1 ASKHA domain-containing protein [Armatimonadota bacterium]MDR7562457.1 ASKHA domain-containing protein [Armatimonadota bacterium]MDR7567045.1 ASKHA domain-containing protein [Armatimonadota bacterium]MDR7601170.1 ASKHA domain-containing protein [Armatimonadota bacterium]